MTYKFIPLPGMVLLFDSVILLPSKEKQEIFTDGYRNSIIRILQWISAYHMKKNIILFDGGNYHDESNKNIQ